MNGWTIDNVLNLPAEYYDVIVEELNKRRDD